MTKLRDEVQLFKVNTQVPQEEKSSKAAPPKTNAPKVVKRVCAVVSSETCESEPVDNQQHDESDEDGFARVTRKRPARAKPKAVIGTNNGVWRKARSG